MGADGSGNGLHRLGAHDPRRAAAADVEHGDGVVVGVGDEQAGLVGAQLHGLGRVPDVHEGELLGGGRVAHVDDRDRAAAGATAARLVGPVGDVEQVARRVDGEAVGVEADRRPSDHGAHAAVGGCVDDRDPGARRLTGRAHVGRAAGLAQRAGDVEVLAVEEHVPRVAGHPNAVADRRVLPLGDGVSDVVDGNRLGVGGVERHRRGSGQLVAPDTVGVAARGGHRAVRCRRQAHEEVGGGRDCRGERIGVDGVEGLHAAVVRRHDQMRPVGRESGPQREPQHVHLAPGGRDLPPVGRGALGLVGQGEPEHAAADGAYGQEREKRSAEPSHGTDFASVRAFSCCSPTR